MKKCLVIVNIFKEESQKLALEIENFLVKENIQCELFNFDGKNLKLPTQGIDFVVTLGGDGTVLFAARACASLGIPVFPINLGQFGFIASIQKNEWQGKLKDFIQGKIPLSPRSMISTRVFRGKEKVFFATALNDVVIAASAAAKLISLELKFENNSFGSFCADGIIVATATGSTAYSVAAGGPIIDPSLDALLLNPISPFSLSNRPLVLPPEGILEALVLPSRTDNIVLTADGQVSDNLQIGDRIEFSLAKDKVLLVGCSSDSFYGALRSKLHWSGGPLA